jgi:hypothetical protein
MPSWRHNALAYVDGTTRVEDPLDYTRSSPIKKLDAEMEDDDSMDSRAKRGLLWANRVTNM